MKDMRAVVRNKIDDLDSDIQERYKQLEKSVDDFRQLAMQATSYDIVTWMPAKIRDIEWQRKRIEELEEQKRMLIWMEKEAEK